MPTVLEDFKKRIKETDEALKELGSVNIPKISKDDIFDYKKGREHYKIINLNSAVENLKNDAWKLVEFYNTEGDNKFFILQILNLSEQLKKDISAKDISKILKEINKNMLAIKPGKTIEQDISFIKVGKLPEVIGEEIAADLNEIRKCFSSGSYRSCVILCGRILETALHRKYYEVSGQDLLETSAGIGLGKIVAKLKEKDVKVDPGLTQQIHLINQVRVFSVHSKKETFYPSKEQAQATILFTLDVLRKLFE